MSTVLSLKAREKIEARLDDLIGRAEQLVNTTHIAAPPGLELAQLRNLLNLASSTDSFKAVELFIQYQMGREKGGKGWLHDNFGQRLIHELYQLEQMAEQIAEEAKEKKGQVKMELVRLFIGYMTRYFSYCKSSE
jgi:hypothetical protein